METQKINISGLEITIPAYYQQVQSMPDDPENSKAYMIQTENAICFVLIYPITLEQTIPRDKEMLIAGVRQFLNENQGLIQIETGSDYAYSVVKTLKQPSGVQYILTYQKFYQDIALNIQAFFEEIGTTGIRDNIVYELWMRENSGKTDGDPFEGWTQDPYDSEISDGALMNISEQQKYDEQFPGFPLSMCREFIKVL